MAKTILWPGLLAGLAAFIINMIIGYLFMLIPSVAAEYANPAIMRTWDDPLMWIFYAYPFVQGLILAWVWDKVKSMFHGSLLMRGMNFGLVIWLISTVPGMLATYGSMPYGFWTVMSWVLGGLGALIASGIVYARLNSAKTPEPAIVW